MKDLTESELTQFQRFIFQQAGISLPGGKKALVMGRLGKRVAEHQLASFGDYYRLLVSGHHPEEVQVAVDLLTTNETYFFRESKHFDFLRDQALSARNRVQPFRVWSAASSSGEEAYSIAMLLDECLASTPWEVLGTDISTHVLRGAARALYPMDRARHIPKHYLQKYCLKGTGDYEGHLLVSRTLRSRVKFQHLNLNEDFPSMGLFDVVFLRNVMIYFNDETKRQVIARIQATLKPGGYLFVGHSESLNNLDSGMQSVVPAIYHKKP